MNVTTSGPKGYDFQYLASLYLGLEFMSRQSLLALAIENVNGEDATLKLKSPIGGFKIAELQCKNKKASLNLTEFAKILTHFGNRKTDDNLLSRLLSGSVDYLYIIYTGRVRDFAEELHLNTSEIVMDRFSVRKLTTKKAINQLIDEIAKSVSKTSPLRKKQNLFNQTLVLQLKNNPDRLSEVLSRIIILEKLDEVQLQNAIKSLLRNHFKISEEYHYEFFNEATAVVKNGRANGADISKTLTDLLMRFRSDLPAVPSIYVDRGNEIDFVESLRNHSVLLLTGQTQCGKSLLALKTARLFIANTTALYRNTGDVGEAERFLQDNNLDKRLCILEDPFGQVLTQESNMLLKRINSLISIVNSMASRYLIITSREDVILHFGKSFLSKWIDVTVSDTKFLEKIWFASTQNKPMDERVTGIVIDGFKTDRSENLLQPGQLDYLVNNSENLGEINKQSVNHLARSTAREILLLVNTKGHAYTEMMALLGICATNFTGPSIIDLSYILTSDEDYLPGINKVRSSSVGGIFSDEEPDYNLPVYKGFDKTGEIYIPILEELERMGLIISEHGIYRFKHPIYQETARLTIGNSPDSFFDRIVKYNLKAIGSLNHKLGLNAVKFLFVLYELTSDNEERRFAVFTLAKSALMSTFVVVRDAAVLFFAEMSPKVPKGFEDVFEKNIRERYPFGVYWDNDIPFVPDKKHLKWTKDYRAKFLTSEELENMQQQASTNRLNSEDAWTLLRGLDYSSRNKKSRILLNVKLLSPFMRYDESFIRERAAFLFAASIDDAGVLELCVFLKSSDPFIVFQLIKGAIRAYPYLQGDVNKKTLLDTLIASFDNSLVVRYAFNFMTQFDAGHTSHTFDWRDDIEDSVVPEMWFVWAELMPVFFKHLPSKVSVNSGRFMGTMEETKKLSNDQNKAILLAWLTWFESTNQYRGMGEFLVRYMFSQFKKISTKERLGILSRMLATGNAMICGEIIRGLMHKYNQLSEGEKTFLTEYIAQAPHYLQSLALTASGVPPEIQKTITGGFIIENLLPAEIIEKLDKERMFECLAFLYLDSRFIDIDYKNLEFWNNILGYAVLLPDSPVFPVALKTMLESVFNSGLYRNIHWPSCPEIVQQILARQEMKLNDMIFSFLLEEMVTNRYSPAKRYVKIFFENLPDEQVKRFAEKVGMNLEAILSHDNFSVIPLPVRKKYIYPLFDTDNAIYNLVNETPLNAERVNEIFSFFKEKQQNGEIRAYTSIQRIEEWMKTNSVLFSSDQINLVNLWGDQYYEKASLQWKEIDRASQRFFALYHRSEYVYSDQSEF